MVLTPENRDKWARNTLQFLAPLLVIYLVYLQSQLADGFSWNDFRPNPVIIGSMILYVCDVVLDFLKKFRASRG